VLPVAMKVLSKPEKMAWQVEYRHKLGRSGRTPNSSLK
jgi:hypothetical protein